MPRVFVYEHLCAGAPGAESWRVEGWAMLSAVLADLARVPGVEVVTLLDPSLARQGRETGADVRVRGRAYDLHALFRECEFALVIAPEVDFTLTTPEPYFALYELCQRAEGMGARLLGPSARAVYVTGDKFGMAEHFGRHDVRTPPTGVLSCGSEGPFPLVVKPRHGAGSQATFLLQNADEFAECRARARDEGWTGELVCQPWVAGQPVSVALLGGPAGLRALPACSQDVAPPRFRYHGGRLPLSPDLDGRARRLALQAAGCVPGLAGWFGVDLVLGERPEDDAVIEINPRLTTSYVGLRELATFNLAGAILSAVTGSPSVMTWRAGEVSFTPDGRVTAR